MFDYLQQFNSLPKALRDKVSSQQVMLALTDLEKRYRVDLAMVVMRVMIKNLDVDDLPPTFVSELGLAPDKAESLAKEMRLKIFAPVADYVGLNEESEFDLEKNINDLIKQAGISIASEALIERFSKILATYLKGIRSRIDARHALSKDVTVGGLGLSDLEIDRVFKVCDLKRYEAGSSNYNPPSSTRLQEIMNGSAVKLVKDENKQKQEQLSNLKIGKEYDLKRALQSGETKPVKGVENKVKDDEKEKVNNGEDGKEDSSILRQELEQEISKLDSTKPQEKKREKIDLDKFKKTEKTEVEGKSHVDKVLPIVNKPESSSFFKKLFAQEKNKIDKGIKLAEVAEDKNKNESEINQGKEKVKPEKIEEYKGVPAKEQVARVKDQAEGVKKEQEGSDKIRPEAQGNKMQIKASPAKRPQVSSNRPRLDDIRAVPKVMGPLEELQYLNLENFRRLGKNPEEITNKVFNKIKMLEKDGYDKLIAGISAWKKSPVNRLYLKSLNEAMAKGMTVKEANKQATNNSLSFEEIEAIINLNSRLVF